MVLRRRHHEFALEVTPPGHVHAFDPAAPVADGTTFVGAYIDDGLVAIGAVREVEAGHWEVKSMHTAAEARGLGAGRAVLQHLLDLVAREGATQVSLETGTYPAFAPARALYEAFGFMECPPFADYADNPFSVCMTRRG